MTQAEFNTHINRAKAEIEAYRETQMIQYATAMFAVGYRAKELVIFHHVREMAAVVVDDKVLVSDPTRMILGPRTPVFAYRLWMRRLWRTLRPYHADMSTIERRYL